jgi:hypothetical protein
VTTSTFEALSYAWGSQEKPHYIELDEGSLPITDSLFKALVRLRLPRRARVLWADAICINQENNAEKSKQITLMP